MQLSSKNNITPKLWGPHFWRVFHLTAFGFPNDPNDFDKKVYKSFYENFANILPCNMCKSEAIKMNKFINWDKCLSSRENLIKWTYEYHADVTSRLSKISPDYNHFLSNFLKEVNKNVYNCDRSKEYIIIAILILILFIIIRNCT